MEKNKKRAKLVEIVINSCSGGFNLSEQACRMLGYKPNINVVENPRHQYDTGLSRFIAKYRHQQYRTDPKLVEVIRTLGKEANGEFSELEIVAISKKYEKKWRIKEYDGAESVEFCVPLPKDWYVHRV
jgi:hypothetical protein